MTIDRGRIRAYIAEHRATFGSDAVRQQLVESGYSASDVDAELAAFDAPADVPAVSEAAAEEAPPTWRPVWLPALAIALVNGVVVVATIGLSDRLPASMSLLTIPAVCVIAEIVAGVVLMRTGQRDRGMGVLAGAVASVVLPPAIALGLFGIFVGISGLASLAR